MVAATPSKHAAHRSAALLARWVDVGVNHGQGAGQALRHDRDVVPDAVALQLVGAEVQRPVLVVDPHLARHSPMVNVPAQPAKTPKLNWQRSRNR